jgi:hypothetical protein
MINQEEGPGATKSTGFQTTRSCADIPASLTNPSPLTELKICEYEKYQGPTMVQSSHYSKNVLSLFTYFTYMPAEKS